MKRECDREEQWKGPAAEGGKTERIKKLKKLYDRMVSDAALPVWYLRMPSYVRVSSQSPNLETV